MPYSDSTNSNATNCGNSAVNCAAPVSTRANWETHNGRQQQGDAFTRTMARHMDSNMDVGYIGGALAGGAATVLGPALAWSPAMADTPSAGAGNVQHNDNSTHSHQLTIQQLPGEDQRALTERIMREIERFNQQRGREMLGDGV